MPSANTEQFGVIEYAEESTISFPRGLPGFEQCRQFVMLDAPGLAPLVHLQSLEIPGLCFLALPVRSIDGDYQTALTAEDCEVLGLDTGERSTLDLAMLAVAADGRLTANLMAPIVIHLSNGHAVQAVRADARYSHQHVLADAETISEESSC
jgi:flagellar assembly factor FliW